MEGEGKPTAVLCMEQLTRLAPGLATRTDTTCISTFLSPDDNTFLLREGGARKRNYLNGREGGCGRSTACSAIPAQYSYFFQGHCTYMYVRASAALFIRGKKQRGEERGALVTEA